MGYVYGLTTTWTSCRSFAEKLKVGGMSGNSLRYLTWPGPWPSISVVKRDLSVAAETWPGKRPWKEGNLKTGKLL